MSHHGDPRRGMPGHRPAVPLENVFRKERRSIGAVVMRWVGAASSVTLIGAFLYGTWQLAVRDVSQVPVIVALEGPLRTAGDEAGSNDGDDGVLRLSVNEVQEAGKAVAPPSEVILAPPPITLSGEDSPPIVKPATRPVAGLQQVPAREVEQVQDVAARMDDVQTDAPAAQGEAAIAPSVTPPAEALPKRPRTLVERSPRPRARPSLRVAASDIDEAVRLAVAETVDVAPEQINPGDRLVQLGAYDSIAEARAEWDRLVRTHADLLGGKKRLIQQAESGGKAFYRLRAVGFSDLADARRLCSALMARKVNCIAVTVR